MLTQAPRGMYRVIGLAPIDTLTWPSGPLWKDCETLDEARDLADCNGDLYAWVYVYNDAGEILYESGSERQQHLDLLGGVIGRVLGTGRTCHRRERQQRK